MGLQMALACTFRFVSSSTRMGLPEINMAFFPSMGATQRLTRLIGEAKAIEMIVTGEPIDATEAYRLGIANRLVPPGELRRTVGEFAVKLSEKSPHAVMLAIDAIRHARTMSTDEGLAYEARLAEECLKSDDAKEGMRAFYEKRKPSFKGR
jgi:enoyl-CoA hydratase